MNFLSRNSGIVAYMAIESDAKRGLQGDAQAIERLALLYLTPEVATYALNKVNFLDESNPKTMSEYSKLFRTDNRTVKLRQGISILSKEMFCHTLHTHCCCFNLLVMTKHMLYLQWF